MPESADAEPMVTVLLAVRDGEASVQAAIESIANQTFGHWGLVVVDDASTDGTHALLHRLASLDQRITLLHNPVPLGLAASLNRAWRASSSQLLARMDADDLAFPGRLEEQVRFLDAHPEVGVLGAGAELMDEAGRVLGHAFRPESHDTLVRRIFRENPFIHPSVMFRRDFLERLGGYDERLRRAQDYDLWLRGYRITRFHNLMLPLIRYRVRKSPTSEALLYGTFVLLRAAFRERRPLTLGWYGVRFLCAGLATRLGLMDGRLR